MKIVIGILQMEDVFVVLLLLFWLERHKMPLLKNTIKIDTDFWIWIFPTDWSWQGQCPYGSMDAFLENWRFVD